MIAIIDYKTGNLRSIQNMIKKIGFQSIITSKKEEINKATKIILPGVGSFDKGMSSLKELELIEILKNKTLKNKVPILGICLGAQLMTKSSEEGVLNGLGFIDGLTLKIKKEKNSNFKVPNMGWRFVKYNNQSKLFSKMYPNPRFYFVHSYHLKINDIKNVIVDSDYPFSFNAGFEFENILGVQFHPEKSHKFGMKLLENFINNY